MPNIGDSGRYGAPNDFLCRVGSRCILVAVETQEGTATKKVRASRIAVVLSFGLISCVTQPPTFTEAPKPPASEKLRVFVQPLEDGYNWRTPYSQYKLMTFEKVKKVWSNTGIYEAVGLDEADSALGKSRAKLRWKQDGYALAIEAAH